MCFSWLTSSRPGGVEAVAAGILDVPGYPSIGGGTLRYSSPL